ncbi:MAG: hypothetical protein WC959_05555 [Kiritimatiellales bacterium]
METEEKVGIDSILEAMDFTLELGGDLDKKLDDGKLSAVEAMQLTAHLPAALRVVKSAKNIPAELQDLDDDERKQIVAHFAKKFELSDKDAEVLAERLFENMLNLAKDVTESISIGKDFAAWRKNKKSAE